MITIQQLIFNEFFQSGLIILGSVLGAKFFLFFVKHYLKKFTEKTKSDLDDILVNATAMPVYFTIIFFGVYVAARMFSPLAPYMNHVNNISFVIIVIGVGTVLSKLFATLISRKLNQKKSEKTPMLINWVIVVIVYFIALLTILSHFKVEIGPLITTLGIGGLAIGLALQNTLTNLFAGMHIISDKPVKVGDFIELEDGKNTGYVEDIGWRSTRIRTLPGNIIVIPNARLAESIIINSDMPNQDMSVVIKCGVAYDSDLEKVEKVTVAAAKKVQQTAEGAIKDFEPFIRYHTFGDSNIEFSIILRVDKYVDKYPVTHELIKALKKAYDKEGIEISWPVRKIYSEAPVKKAVEKVKKKVIQE